MKSFIRVSAPGKLHLLGEHSVVYGKPAIIAAVDKRCFVAIKPRKDKAIEIISKNFNTTKTVTEEEILTKTKYAKDTWNTFSNTNDTTLLKTLTTEPLDYSEIVIGETLAYYGKPLRSGFTLTIDSEIPIGSGMGSSAALAVAVTGAVSLFLDCSFDKEVMNTIAFLAEQKKHGFPSGGDNSASCYGGLIWYRRETPDFKIIQPVPFTIPRSVAKNFFTVFTGIPDESTGEMVSFVRAFYNTHKTSVDKILNDQELVTRELLSAIKEEDNTRILRSIRAGEKNLEKIGVVSPYVQSLMRKIEKAGGAAKICGGGGKTKGTGTVLVYHTDRKKIGGLLEKEGVSLSGIMLGEEGVRVERT